MRFFISDVFAEKKYSGNQLATFLDCESIDNDEMQRIAREMNFSECSFITSDLEKNGGYDVRIFTPEREVDFAGHPTIGTADVIKRRILSDNAEKVVLNLKVGQIPVEFAKDGKAWMTQVSPRFGRELAKNDVASALGIKTDVIDPRWPIMEVSTGFPHIIVPLLSLKALKKCRVNHEAYFRLVRGAWAENILVFCLEGQEVGQQCSVRVFPLSHGIAEDPATGSGNGCLAAYLSKYSCLGATDVDLCVGQGYEIGRPSSLYLKAGRTNDGIMVKVGGKVFPIASGTWDF